MTITKLLIICATLIFVSIISTGIFECSEKKYSKTFWKSILQTAKIGLCKVLSSVGVALLTTISLAFLLSLFIKPEPQDVMPALYYDGTYIEYNAVEKTTDTINMILEESEKRITSDPESAYYDMAYAYFSSGNYDLAVDALKKCYAENPKWEYAYNIGVSYGYLMDYSASIKYLNEALTLNPPLDSRAVILDKISMLENYFSSWISSLFQ